MEDKKLDNESTETRLTNGIMVITSVKLVDKADIPPGQALAMQKARRLLYKWFVEAENEHKSKNQT